jgi:hypothetical protein
MRITYQIVQDQGSVLVQLCEGRPASAWDIPEPCASSITSVEVDDFGGHCFCDVVKLDDGRVILVTASGAVHEENAGLACIYPSLQDAYDGENESTLVLQS